MIVFLVALQAVVVLLVLYHRERHSLSDYEKWSENIACFEKHVKCQLVGAGSCLLVYMTLSKETSGWIGFIVEITGAAAFYLITTALLFWWNVKRWSRLNDE